MKRLNVLFLTLIVFVALVLPVNAREYQGLTQSQLAVRRIQTRVYPTANTQEVFKATINSLQDEGFTILNIEDEIGYIRAKKEIKDTKTDQTRIAGYSLLLISSVGAVALGSASSSKYIVDSVLRLKNEMADKTVVMDLNADIDTIGSRTKVRVVMVETVLENADGYSYVKSSPRKVTRITDPNVYQAFFIKLKKNIFYENNSL